jgi:hypothetical protein
MFNRGDDAVNGAPVLIDQTIGLGLGCYNPPPADGVVRRFYA